VQTSVRFGDGAGVTQAAAALYASTTRTRTSRSGVAAAPRLPPCLRQRRDRVPLAELLPHRVRLRRPTALRETACLLGDTIGRAALSSQELDRPVAFLGGRDVAPLVGGLA
jgi:hypothetical protein